MKFAVVLSFALIAVFAATTDADVMSLRQYVQTVTQPAAYPAQTGNELWQFRIANGMGTGTFLSPGGIYYYYPFHPNLVPIAGYLYNIGDGGVLDSAINGILAHPGAVPLGIVLQIQNDNTFINTARVLADMVDNGYNSNGIGVSVYTNINSVVSQAGSRVVYGPANTAPDAAEFLFPIQQTFNTGDRIEFHFDPNGSELYDQSVVDIQFVVPEPASLALIAAGSLMLVRRRLRA